MSETLTKYNLLFNDARSPVYSAIQTIAQYKGDKGVPSFNRMYRDLDDFVNNRIDLSGLQKEQRQLEALVNEVQRGQQTIKGIHQYLLKENQELNKDYSSVPAIESQKTKAISEQLEKRIKQMYSEY